MYIYLKQHASSSVATQSTETFDAFYQSRVSQLKKKKKKKRGKKETMTQESYRENIVTRVTSIITRRGFLLCCPRTSLQAVRRILANLSRGKARAFFGFNLIPVPSKSGGGDHLRSAISCSLSIPTTYHCIIRFVLCS